jgi:hypothetical protein
VSASPPQNGEARPAEAPPSDSTQAPTGLECPRCGTPHAPDQEYCLECGLRLPVEAVGFVPRLSRAWQRRFGWYPGDWVWPSLLALVLAALAGIGAAAFVAHDQHRASYVTATSPFGPVTSTFGAPPESTTVSTGTTPTGTGPQETPAPSRKNLPSPTLKQWPTGRSGWTVVLASLPTTNGRDFALAQARAAEHGGIEAVGIIDSANFSSLHPGYYVLFAGVYSSFDDASTGATTARAHGYPRAYAKRITP